MLVTKDTNWRDIIKSVFPSFDGNMLENVRPDGMYKSSNPYFMGRLIGIQLTGYSVMGRSPMRRVLIKGGKIDTGIIVEKVNELNEEARIIKERADKQNNQEKVLSDKARKMEEEYGLPSYALSSKYGMWQFALGGLTEAQVRRIAQAIKQTNKEEC